MTFISFSQNFEDVMLWRALKSVQKGFYIDVGAHDPTNGSVTKAFYDLGWSGINIEPIPAPFGLLQAARPRDINLQVCAGTVNGEIDIYDVLPSGLATAKLNLAEEYRAAGHSVSIYQVPVRTLANICRENVKGEIHFLKIDVEGFEKEVLLGADLSEFRPWVVVVEATQPNSSKVNYFDWENIVLNAGYLFAYFDGLNRFYVAVEHKDLLTCFDTPPNYFDDFALSSTCFFSRQVATELQQAKIQLQQAEAKAQQAKIQLQQAEAKAQQADTIYVAEERRALAAEAHVMDILSSTSWQLTAPLRIVSSMARSLFKCPNVIKPKISEKIKLFLAHAKLYINRRLSLKHVTFTILARFPSLANRIRSVSMNASPVQIPLPHVATKLGGLRPSARHIYDDLTAAIVKQGKENS